jgi:hypothetical protein
VSAISRYVIGGAIAWCGLFSFAPLLFAGAVDDFQIRTVVGDDTTPPSVPILLAAVPIVPTQIDVNWSVSTDDFELAGYVVSRDGVPIATTTQTSFSDTGLTPSTTYAYTVVAFDWVFNYSTSSNEISTTTPALPVPPPPATTTPTTSGGSGKIMLVGPLSITATTSSASIRFETNRPSRYEIRWGQTSAYELGYIATDRFRTQHATVLTDLIPGTTYYYEVVAFNPANNIPQRLGQGTFTTTLPTVRVSPANVAKLTAVVSGDDVTLRWDRRHLDATMKVRVVRSHLGFPADHHDGMVVYQGDGSEFFDEGAVRGYEVQYYTVFTIDRAGVLSSGAVVRATRLPQLPVAGEDDPVPVTPPVVLPDIILPLLDRSFIEIEQAGRRYAFSDEPILLFEDSPLVIRIPVAATPPHLKSIIVTLLDPTDQRRQYSFLLRREPGAAHYEAVIPPVAVSGPSLMTVEVFDFSTGLVGRYSQPLSFRVAPDLKTRVVFPDALFAIAWGWWFLSGVVGVLLVAGWWRWLYRRRRREDKTPKK